MSSILFFISNGSRHQTVDYYFNNLPQSRNLNACWRYISDPIFIVSISRVLDESFQSSVINTRHVHQLYTILNHFSFLIGNDTAAPPDNIDTTHTIAALLFLQCIYLQVYETKHLLGFYINKNSRNSSSGDGQMLHSWGSRKIALFQLLSVKLPVIELLLPPALMLQLFQTYTETISVCLRWRYTKKSPTQITNTALTQKETNKESTLLFGNKAKRLEDIENEIFLTTKLLLRHSFESPLLCTDSLSFCAKTLTTTKTILFPAYATNLPAAATLRQPSSQVSFTLFLSGLLADLISNGFRTPALTLVNFCLNTLAQSDASMSPSSIGLHLLPLPLLLRSSSFFLKMISLTSYRNCLSCSLS